MTIAISLKVYDGLVLATDSATTIPLLDQNGNMVDARSVYNNANKVFNLYKGLPVGAITWGLGTVGFASISLLVKDFRARLMGIDDPSGEWRIEPGDYSLEDVAQKFYRYIYHEKYLAEYEGKELPKSLMGFVVGGYSSGQSLADEYIVEVSADGLCPGPVPLRLGSEGGVTWHGQGEALDRLLSGFGGRLPTLLEQIGVPADQVPLVIQFLKLNMGAGIYTPTMPIQDAIDLADFLADLTARYSRFTPGPTTVGGAIEIAAITKHEGFKWVRRKHYYSRDLNPEEARRERQRQRIQQSSNADADPA